MKKIFSILAIACVALLFSACKKDGVYNPSKKISRIYNSSIYEFDGSSYHTDKQLQEVWTWNKNNTLAKIEFYSGDNVTGTETFTYNKKQLTRIDGIHNGSLLSGSYNYAVEYKYKGSQLIEATCYEGNEIGGTYKFTHKNGKITKIEEYLDLSKSSETNRISILRHILPDQIYQSVERNQENSKLRHNSKGTLTATWYLTWDKSNVAKVEMTETDGANSEMCTFEYQYDNYNNPFYGYLNGELSETIGGFNFSKNNITQETARYDNGSVSTLVYQYTYADKYPITISNTQNAGGGASMTITTEYEYK